jgi:ASC-1-like (ASCH) protein
MKVLIMAIKREWFEKIESGEKNIEYREAKPYWEKRLRCGIDEIILRNGYSSNSPAIHARVKRVEWKKTGKDTDLKIDRPVYAIHLSEVTRIK